MDRPGIVGEIIIRQLGYLRHISTLRDLLNGGTLIQSSLCGGLEPALATLDRRTGNNPMRRRDKESYNTPSECVALESVLKIMGRYLKMLSCDWSL